MLAVHRTARPQPVETQQGKPAILPVQIGFTHRPPLVDALLPSDLLSRPLAGEGEHPVQAESKS